MRDKPRHTFHGALRPRIVTKITRGRNIEARGVLTPKAQASVIRRRRIP